MIEHTNHERELIETYPTLYKYNNIFKLDTWCDNPTWEHCYWKAYICFKPNILRWGGGRVLPSSQYPYGFYISFSFHRAKIYWPPKWNLQLLFSYNSSYFLCNKVSNKMNVIIYIYSCHWIILEECLEKKVWFFFI